MIGVVAQMLQVHPQTLRIYERAGLVVPRRSQGKTRLYSHEDLENLKLVIQLTRDCGVNLAGVEVILGMRKRISVFQNEEIQVLEDMIQEMMRGRLIHKKAVKKHPKKSSPRVIPVVSEE